ncbi:unnamed protein product [Adineta ricciae]|uniref:Xenotropic and polytropic retrovirus receptor 1-like protein n=1 Tax=Adineta ricciae TaxID=249248 RepID=A0A813PG32_ADIRI|nr:unnamed protein product [Adineta ricciae]CAF1359956.1 unnamed protein product [Adineta ricciae]
MKFGEHLWTHLTPEWYSQYIEYDQMKEMLAGFVASAQHLSGPDNLLARQLYFLQADEEFFKYCSREASKINTFFAEKLAEALRRFEPLKKEVKYTEEHHRHPHSGSSKIFPLQENGSSSASASRTSIKSATSTRKKKQHERTLHLKISDLKLALSEFYLMLILLKKYQGLNFQGFRKILKKHDKLLQTNRGEQWRLSHIDCSLFHQSKGVDQLIEEVETMFIEKLEHGNRAKAMQRLRVPPLEEKQPRIVTFRLGVFIGMLCFLCPVLLILAFALRKTITGKDTSWRAALHLYRPLFLIILHICFVGLNIYGWGHFGVNHVLIFEFDPRNHITYQKLLEIGTFLMSCWFFSFTIFFITSYYEYQPFIQPLLCLVFLLIFFLNPTRTCYHKARFWLLRKLFQVICAPFYHVDFASFWLGDQLISLELIFFDIEYFLCFYIHDANWNKTIVHRGALCTGWSQFFIQAVLIILPSWFRFAQCLRRYHDTKQKFPHLANAGKYASGFLVSITNVIRRATNASYKHDKTSNPYLYLWAISALFGATYKLIWDLKMDWGFFDKNAGENKFLREQIVYPSKYVYYIVIIENIIFRYVWIINIFVYFDTEMGEYSDMIGFGFGIIELFRRFLWNYFRLENEHLNNCGQFRAVRDISVNLTSVVATPFSGLLDKIAKENQMENYTHARKHHTVVNFNIENNVTIPNEPLSSIEEEHVHTSDSQTSLESRTEQIVDDINEIMTMESSNILLRDDDAID